MLKTLVNMGGGVNRSGFKSMEVGTEANCCCRYFWVHVSMERRNGAVYEKYLRIVSFTEIINLGFVSLVGCGFNEVHGVATDGENHNIGYYCWYPGSI